MRSRAHLIAAADFFTSEVWTARGLVRYFTLFVVDIASRQVFIAVTTTNPTSAWMVQIAPNLTDCYTGFLCGKRYLIIDRDILFAPQFKKIIEDVGIDIIRTAYRAPNMNAHDERFVRSIKSECLDQIVDMSERLSGLLRYCHRRAA